MDNQTKHTEEDIEKLLKDKSSFISIKADIFRTVEPTLIQLELENFSNTRNTIIISGALATVGLVAFDSFVKGASEPAIFSLQLSIILFLLVVLTFTFSLDRNILSATSALKKERNKYIKIADEAIRITYEGLDGKISKSGVDEKLIPIYREIDQMSRMGSVTQIGKKTIEWYLVMVGNALFFSAVLSLVFALSYDIIISVFT